MRSENNFCERQVRIVTLRHGEDLQIELHGLMQEPISLMEEVVRATCYPSWTRNTGTKPALHKMAASIPLLRHWPLYLN